MNYILLILTILITTSCNIKKFQSELKSSAEKMNQSTGVPTPSPVNPIDLEPPPFNFKFEPLAWEKKSPINTLWSNYIFNYIQKEQSQMLSSNSASDVELFCPKYKSLNDSQRLNFWGQFFAAVSKFESGWNPASRMVETTMGTDPVTGRQVASEGLLQLSYQDDVSYRNLCEFNWSKDQFLSDTDPKKTIFDPYLNLRCGIRIMARQLERKGSLTLSIGVYWSVLKISGRYTKINEISAITKSLTFCK